MHHQFHVHLGLLEHELHDRKHVTHRRREVSQYLYTTPKYA